MRLSVWLTAGSSPRMRGKRFVNRNLRSLTRIIPAHAGQTSPQAPTLYSQSDHPRACGANTAVEAREAVRRGSSPRMRGKRRRRNCSPSAARIIPAHAGQARRRRRLWPSSPDHPRACGANDAARSDMASSTGSSPRMRGKRQIRLPPIRRPRIIPAHAGQTTVLLSRSQVCADHPRACGANPCRPPIRWMNTGSSPRMRGKRIADFEDVAYVRIIPAHAGQT